MSPDGVSIRNVGEASGIVLLRLCKKPEVTEKAVSMRATVYDK